jgi:hypothetical protein
MKTSTAIEEINWHKILDFNKEEDDASSSLEGEPSNNDDT